MDHSDCIEIPAGAVSPEKFITTPKNRLLALFDDPEKGQAAIAELQSMGYTGPDDIWAFCCKEGAERIDVTGRRHGLWASLYRLFQRTTHESTHLEEIERELNNGHMLVGVKVANDEQAIQRIAQRLREQGGHSLYYYAHWTFAKLYG